MAQMLRSAAAGTASTSSVCVWFPTKRQNCSPCTTQRTHRHAPQLPVVSLPRQARCSIVVRASTSEAPSPPWHKKDARLVLQDGSVWLGRSFGSNGKAVAEVVFNTSLTGYQEILTDASYKGQMVCFTHPHIGNTGINLEDMESKECHLSGIVVRDYPAKLSNYRSAMTLDAYLKTQNVMGIADVDTRAITRRLRTTGCLNGVMCTDESITDDELLAIAKSWTISGKDLIREVSCTEPYVWKEPTDEEWEFSKAAMSKKGGKRFHVVAYDYGIKHNILRRLAAFNCKITVVPADYSPEKVMALNPDGIFLSNGPGDPITVPYAVENTRQLLGKKPLFGICMGHQVLGQALGGTTFKLKFGHHGGNHPIRFNGTGRIEISAQNHNYAVDPATLPSDVEVTHINLNDGTCAGMLCKPKKAMSIQYHPESSPGPHDADVCFEQFIAMLEAEAGVPA